MSSVKSSRLLENTEASRSAIRAALWTILIIIDDVSDVKTKHNTTIKEEMIGRFTAMGQSVCDLDLIRHMSKGFSQEQNYNELVINSDVAWRLDSLKGNIWITTHYEMCVHARSLGVPTLVYTKEAFVEGTKYKHPYVDYVYTYPNMRHGLAVYPGAPLATGGLRTLNLLSSDNEEKGRRRYVAFPSGSGKSYYIDKISPKGDKKGMIIDQDNWISNYEFDDGTKGWPKKNFWWTDPVLANAFHLKMRYSIQDWLSSHNDGKIMIGSERNIGYEYRLSDENWDKLLQKRADSGNKVQPITRSPGWEDVTLVESVASAIDKMGPPNVEIQSEARLFGDSLRAHHVNFTKNVYMCGSELESLVYSSHPNVTEISNVSMPYNYDTFNTPSNSPRSYDNPLSLVKSYCTKVSNVIKSDSLCILTTKDTAVTDILRSFSEHVKAWLFDRILSNHIVCVIDTRTHPQDNRTATDKVKGIALLNSMIDDSYLKQESPVSGDQVRTLYSLCLIMRNPLTCDKVEGHCLGLFSLSNSANPRPSDIMKALVPRWSSAAVNFPTRSCEVNTSMSIVEDFVITNTGNVTFTDWMLTNKERLSLQAFTVRSSSKDMLRLHINYKNSISHSGSIRSDALVFIKPYVGRNYHNMWDTVYYPPEPYDNIQTISGSQTGYIKTVTQLMRVSRLYDSFNPYYLDSLGLHNVKIVCVQEESRGSEITGYVTKWPTHFSPQPQKSKAKDFYTNGELRVPVSVSGHVIYIIIGIVMYEMTFCYNTYANTQHTHFSMLQRNNMKKDYKDLKQRGHIMEGGLSDGLVLYHNPLESYLGVCATIELFKSMGVPDSRYSEITSWFVNLFQNLQSKYATLSLTLSFEVKHALTSAPPG